eukprot:405078_1
MNNEWSVGSLCEIYSNSIQEWFDGEIVQIIRGNSVRVKFGIYEKVLPINSSDLRPRKILYAFETVHIKSFNMFLSQYILSKPLTINKTINVNNENNRIQIFSTHTIEINKHGEIKICGNVDLDSKENEEVELVGKNLIHLVSLNNIIVHGILDTNSDEGVIALDAANQIIINGSLLCGKNGKIAISRRFVDNRAYNSNKIFEKIENVYKYGQIPCFPWQIIREKTTKLSLSPYSHSGKGRLTINPQALLEANDKVYYFEKRNYINEETKTNELGQKSEGKEEKKEEHEIKSKLKYLTAWVIFKMEKPAIITEFHI